MEKVRICNAPDDVISIMDSVQLKKLRKDLGFNQEQMAKALGLSGKNYISMLESGKFEFSPSVTKCMEYIRVLLDLGHKINL